MFQVTGDSIYNLTRLSEIETDKDDRPLDPPKILSVEVSRIKQTYILLYVNGIIQLVSLLVIALTSLSHSRAMLRSQSCDWSNATFEHFFYYTPITTDHVSNCEKYVGPLDFFDKIIMWEGSDQLVFFLNSLF